jgi:hypothetical protein
MKEWWIRLIAAVPPNHGKKVLVGRCLWLERNNMVFDSFATMPWRFVEIIGWNLRSGKGLTCAVFLEISSSGFFISVE